MFSFFKKEKKEPRYVYKHLDKVAYKGEKAILKVTYRMTNGDQFTQLVDVYQQFRRPYIYPKANVEPNVEFTFQAESLDDAITMQKKSCAHFNFGNISENIYLVQAYLSSISYEVTKLPHNYTIEKGIYVAE